MCGAYGWISDTAVSTAKRDAGSSGDDEIAFTSSITADTGVLKTNRRSMSSLTLWIVSCALRARGVAPGSKDGWSRAISSCTMRQSRVRNRHMPSTPVSCHSLSWSAGPMNRM